MKEDETYLKQIEIEQIESVNIEIACINKAYKLFSETIKELKDKNLSTSPHLLELYTELGRHKLVLMSKHANQSEDLWQYCNHEFEYDELASQKSKADFYKCNKCGLIDMRPKVKNNPK